MCLFSLYFFNPQNASLEFIFFPSLRRFIQYEIESKYFLFLVGQCSLVVFAILVTFLFLKNHSSYSLVTNSIVSDQKKVRAEIIQTINDFYYNCGVFICWFTNNSNLSIWTESEYWRVMCLLFALLQADFEREKLAFGKDCTKRRKQSKSHFQNPPASQKYEIHLKKIAWHLFEAKGKTTKKEDKIFV